MTIAELIENLCIIIAEMADLINRLSLRLQQTGVMTEGEQAEIDRVRRRIAAVGISSTTKE